MAYCSQCGAPVDGARFCSQCGEKVTGSRDPNGGSGGQTSQIIRLSESRLGALAYFTPIPALAFLLFEPFNRNRFVRFHSYQCLFLTIVALLFAATSGVITIFSFLEGLLTAAFEIVLVVLWVIAAFKAWRGVEYRLPIIGSYAAEQAARFR